VGLLAHEYANQKALLLDDGNNQRSIHNHRFEEMKPNCRIFDRKASTSRNNNDDCRRNLQQVDSKLLQELNEMFGLQINFTTERIHRLQVIHSYRACQSHRAIEYPN